MMEKEKERGSGSAGGRLRRAAALCAVILLAGLYLAAFLLAVLGDERSAGLLRFCLGMTIFLPLFLWVVIWCAGVLTHRHSIASADLFNSNPDERRRMEEACAAAAAQEGDSNPDGRRRMDEA